jgi:PIN domain nuclease of toxin-antitoxin system
MNYYLDTSALVKLFHQEEGTDFVTDLISHKQSSIFIL